MRLIGAGSIDGRMIVSREQIRQRYLFGGHGDEVLRATTRMGKMKLYLRGNFLPTLIASLPLTPLLPLWNVGVDARYLQASLELHACMV